jgi:hypothetical protein
LPANTKFEISQEGAALTLIVTSPAATGDPLEHVLDFRGWAGSRTVALSTNAPWTFATGAGYSDVVASAKIAGTDLAAGVTQSEGHTPDLPTLTPTITFTPITTQSSGTTVVTFSTVVPGATGMMNISETVTLKRDMSTYIISADRTTLTLYTNFPRGTDLTGLNNTNIPDIQSISPYLGAYVKTLVMLGDKTVITEDQVAGIKNGFFKFGDLKNVSLPDFDGTIPEEAFMNATYLINANFPKVTHIGEYAFYACRAMESINSPLVQSIGEYAFNACDKLVEAYFPDATDIEQYAFIQCSGLTDAYFPEAINVGNNTFMYCTSLADIFFPKLTGVVYYMFFDCESLTEVSFPSATSVEMSAFNGCTSLKVIDVPNAHTFGLTLFTYCPEDLTLKIDSPQQQVKFEKSTFSGVGLDPDDSSKPTTGTEEMTLYLGAGAQDELGNYRPDNLPQDKVQWGGYKDPANHNAWVPYTWGRIEKYEDQTPAP